jgi:hypothetical protein
MQTEKKCNECKKRKTLKPQQWALVGLSVYVFISAIYGTVKITEFLISMFF